MNLVRNALFKEFDFLIQQYGMLLGFFFFFQIFSLVWSYSEILHFHVRAVPFRFYDTDTIIEFIF